MKMDVKRKIGRLNQLRYLKNEVYLLSRRIARLDDQIEENRRLRWRGRIVMEYGARLAALRERLALRRARCMEQLGALYGFIDDIDDSLLRQIMAARYIDALTWKEVAAIIGERDEQYPRRLHNRFLMRNELPEAAGGSRKDEAGASGAKGGAYERTNR